MLTRTGASPRPTCQSDGHVASGAGDYQHAVRQRRSTVVALGADRLGAVVVGPELAPRSRHVPLKSPWSETPTGPSETPRPFTVARAGLGNRLRGHRHQAGENNEVPNAGNAGSRLSISWRVQPPASWYGHRRARQRSEYTPNATVGWGVPRRARPPRSDAAESLTPPDEQSSPNDRASLTRMGAGGERS